MADRFVIVSQDEELTRHLSQALVDAAFGGEPIVLSEHPTPADIRRAIDRGSDPVIGVIVGLSDQDAGFELIQSLRLSHPNVVSVGADMNSTADKILGAMRAGAAEFLAPPFDLQHLVERCRNQVRSAKSVAKGKLICFLPAQGGNGASTVSIHVADSLARLTKDQTPPGRVLLVDFDFHSGTIAFRLRLKPEFNVGDALTRSDILDELWGRMVARWNQLEVLAAPPTGKSISYESMQRMTGMFRSALQVYSHIVVDMPTALYSSCRDVIDMADLVYLVCTGEAMSLHLARRRVSDLLEMGVPKERLKVIVNRTGSKKSLNLDDVENVVGAPVVWSLPNDYSTVSEAFLKGGLVPRDSSLGKQFQVIGREIAGAGPQDAKKRKSGWKRFLHLG